MSASPETDPALQNALRELFKIAGMPSSSVVTAHSVQEAVNAVKDLLSHQPGQGPAATQRDQAENSDSGHSSVLIIGQLGLMQHQVKLLLTPLCTNILLAKTMESALLSYQQSFPTFIVIDVLMPTSREGLSLIQAIRQLAQKLNKRASQVVVLSTTGQEENLMEACRNQGIRHVLDRQDGWQQTIIDIFQGNA